MNPYNKLMRSFDRITEIHGDSVYRSCNRGDVDIYNAGNYENMAPQIIPMVQIVIIFPLPPMQGGGYFNY